MGNSSVRALTTLVGAILLALIVAWVPGFGWLLAIAILVWAIFDGIARYGGWVFLFAITILPWLIDLL